VIKHYFRPGWEDAMPGMLGGELWPPFCQGKDQVDIRCYDCEKLEA
jgi:hypothetical protein